jgi:diguanylate cyclase (GGDEF)-like protein/PAS domain S-box-containing protein
MTLNSNVRISRKSKALSAHEKDEQRLRALRRYQILDSPPEKVFDDLVNVAAFALRVPIAFITLIAEDRLWFKAKTGSPIAEIERGDALCSYTVARGKLFTVSDLSIDKRFENNPAVIGSPNARFYAGAPLLTPDGFVLGTVGILDVVPRVLKNHEAQTLNLLSRHVMAQIEMRLDDVERTRLVEQLRVVNERLSESTSILETKFAQKTQALRVSENRFRTVVEGLEEAILITDHKGNVQYANVKITDLTGYMPDEITGNSIYEKLTSSDARDETRVRLSRSRNTQTDIWETNLKRKDGTEFFAELKSRQYKDENGQTTGTLCSIIDISERKRYQEELTRQAYRDTLTDLPNRALFLDRLANAMRVEEAHHRTGLLFIDLDNFKIVNDSLGHAAGDELLITVSSRLQLCVRPEDTLARLGGDEFVILLEKLQDECEAVAIAERVAQCLKTSISLRGRNVYTTASIGVALSDPATNDADVLLRQADIAMYRAKLVGKGNYFLFDKSMSEEAQERLELEDELRLALTNNDLRVHYQPIIEMQTGRVDQIEALVRWQHPTRGLLGPMKFIPLAEESGLIVPLGLWVLENACIEGRRLDSVLPDHKPITVCVNLSTRQFYQENLVDEIASILRSTGLPSHRLKLEITESLMMDSATATSKLNRLKALGVLLAVDDFGTGYSSMSYLGKFPIDSLKIDQSFISQLGRTSDARAIIEAMVMVGKALGLRVTCEGIETAFQHEKLKYLDCDFGQGYHYSRPVDPKDLVHVIEQIAAREDLGNELSKAA